MAPSRWALSIGFVVIALAASPLVAQTPVGDETTVVSNASDSQKHPAIAHDPATGDFLIVWEGKSGGSSVGLFGQRYDSSGEPKGEELQFGSSTDGRQKNPDVSFDPASGEFVVVWEVKSEGGKTLVFQRFAADGEGGAGGAGGEAVRVAPAASVAPEAQVVPAEPRARAVRVAQPEPAVREASVAPVARPELAALAGSVAKAAKAVRAGSEVKAVPAAKLAQAARLVPAVKAVPAERPLPVR